MDIKTKCTMCNKDAIFIQPDSQTGQIIDVCKEHFTWMHIG